MKTICLWLGLSVLCPFEKLFQLSFSNPLTSIQIKNEACCEIREAQIRPTQIRLSPFIKIATHQFSTAVSPILQEVTDLSIRSSVAVDADAEPQKSLEFLHRQHDYRKKRSIPSLKLRSSFTDLFSAPNVQFSMKKPNGWVISKRGLKVQDKVLLDILAIVPLLGSFWLLTWRSKRRKYKLLSANQCQAYPPNGISPAVCGYLNKPQVSSRIFISLIPYWGAQGFLSVRSLQKRHGYENDDLYLEKHRDLPIQFPYYQKLIFKQLFSLGDVTLFSVAGANFSLFEAGLHLKRFLRHDLKIYDKDYWQSFKSGWFLYAGMACIFLIPFIFYHLAMFWTAATLVVLGALCIYVHFEQPKYSESGLRLKSQVKNFKQFLANADQRLIERKHHLDRSYFTRVYSHAIALGGEDHFLDHCMQIKQDAPSWFSDDHRRANEQQTSFTDFRQQFNMHKLSICFGTH